MSEIISSIINTMTSVVGGSTELLKLKSELDKRLVAAIEDMKKAEDEAKKLAEEEAVKKAEEVRKAKLTQHMNALESEIKVAVSEEERIALKIRSYTDTIANMEALNIPTDAAETSLRELKIEEEKIHNRIGELEYELEKAKEELKGCKDSSPVPHSTTNVIHLTAEEKELFSTTIRDIPMTGGDYKYTNSNGKEVYGLPLYNIEIGEKTFRVQLRTGREDLAPGMGVVVSIDHIQTNDGLRYFAWADVETISERQVRLQEEAEAAAAKKEIAAAKKARLEAAEKAKEEVIAKAMKEAEEGSFATMANFFNKKFGAAR